MPSEPRKTFSCIIATHIRTVKAIYFQVMKLLQKGNKERTQEPTAANKTSSRSHALLMVNVKQTAKSRAQTRGAVKFGRLYMIDLAGSERASQTEVF